MQINKIHYEQLEETKRIYINATTLKIREKLNNAFRNPTVEDDMTGIFGKFYKLDKMYKVKYIYERNKQLQPMTFDRYHYLLDVGEDDKGTYIEYAMVYDKLYDPLIRLVYILAIFAVLGYLYYAQSIGAMSLMSAVVLGLIVAASVILVFKKSKESQEECKKADALLQILIDKIDFSWQKTFNIVLY